jgi:hypothetical protein
MLISVAGNQAKRANMPFSTATQGGTMKTAMKKPKARLEVSLGIRLTPAEKAAIEIWAKREERAPFVVVRRLVIANLKAEGYDRRRSRRPDRRDARRRETTHWAQTMLANPDVVPFR